jgi:hypothetical protein
LLSSTPAERYDGERYPFLRSLPLLLGFSVRVTRAYWELIAAVKRPVMRGREVAMQGVSQTPETELPDLRKEQIAACLDYARTLAEFEVAG